MTRFFRLSWPALAVLMAIGASAIIYGGHIAEAVAYAERLEAMRQGEGGE